MAWEGSRIELKNSGISGNRARALSADGLGLYIKSSDALLTNTIVSHNAALATTYQNGISICLPDGSTSSITQSYTTVWDDSEDAYYNYTNPAGTDGNLSQDPEFADTSSTDPADWDYTLAPGSPMLDAGAPTILDTDGTRSDLGAFGGPHGDWSP